MTTDNNNNNLTRQFLTNVFSGNIDLDYANSSYYKSCKNDKTKGLEIELNIKDNEELEVCKSLLKENVSSEDSLYIAIEKDVLGEITCLLVIRGYGCFSVDITNNIDREMRINLDNLFENTMKDVFEKILESEKDKGEAYCENNFRLLKFGLNFEDFKKTTLNDFSFIRLLDKACIADFEFDEKQMEALKEDKEEEVER